MDPRRKPPRWRRAAALAAAAVAVLLALLALLATRTPLRPGALAGVGGRTAGPEPAGRQGTGPLRPDDGAAAGAPSPSTGWEEAAEIVVADLRGLLAGRAAPGAFAEAQAEAARADLALHPPARARVRRMMLGDERDRAWALAAAAALPDVDDDLLGLALRLQRPDDDEVIRLLGAELVDALPPELLSRHEQELLEAFGAERNPLVLAVALPALERLETPRLEALIDTQLQQAGPEMLPVLVGLARDRLPAAELGALGISLPGPTASP